MDKHNFLLLLLLLGSFLSVSKSYSQNDVKYRHEDSLSFRFFEKKVKSFITASRWDSAIYYSKKERDIVSLYADTACILYADLLLEEYYFHYNVEISMAKYYPLIKKSAELYLVLNDTADLHAGSAMFFWAQACYASNDITTAKFYYLKSARIFQKIRIVENYCTAKNQLATIYTVEGDYFNAFKTFENVKEALDTLPKSSFIQYQVASYYNNLASLYANCGSFDKALNCMKKCVQIADASPEAKIHFPPGEYRAMKDNLSIFYFLAGYPDSAAYVNKNLKGDGHISLFDIGNSLSKSLILMNHNPEAAISLLKTSIGLSNMYSPFDWNNILATNSLGLLYSATGANFSADSLFEKQLKAMEASGIKGNSYILAYIASLLNMVIENKKSQVTDSLTSLIRNLISNGFFDTEKLGIPERDMFQYKKLLSNILNIFYTCLDNGSATRSTAVNTAFRLQLLQKNSILNNRTSFMRYLHSNIDTLGMLLYEKWIEARQTLSYQYSLPFNKRLFNTDSLKNYCETLEQKLELNSPKFQTENNKSLNNKNFFPRDKSIANIQFIRLTYKILTNNSYFTDSAVYAALIARGGEQETIFVHLCNENALASLMNFENNNQIDNAQLSQKLYTRQSYDARRLYKLIWQPLLPYLKGVSVINYSTEGLLDNIAFNAICADKTYLISLYDLNRYMNLSDEDTSQQTAMFPASIYLWGKMDYDSSRYLIQDSLFFSPSIISSHLRPVVMPKNMHGRGMKPIGLKEIDDLYNFFLQNNLSVSKIDSEWATEENFKRHASEMSGIVHISTHGFYTPFDKRKLKSLIPLEYISGNIEPLFRSGLAFAGVNYYWLKGVPRANRDDGILTAYEIAQLDLHRVTLLTLSACETGLGDVTNDEGNSGLQRAFKIAGVQNMLVTLWPVPEKETNQLLSLFYKYWLKGKDINRALKAAESDMQKKYPPYYWAGFVLIK
ncbi:MAG TPA: CHAT domain-containing tetratricopeptide repeat protein [Chitinophagaceae bacterium]|nr:CHAT domain-containing tetratricopeptide repeat protein [Chitinophagaceae bacterium]